MLFVLIIFNVTIIAQDLPWIKVEGNHLVTENGEHIIFKALNTSDPDKVEKAGHWNQEYFSQIKSWNANMVRFPIHPKAWRERGKEAYFQLLDKGIEMAKKVGRQLGINLVEVEKVEAVAVQSKKSSEFTLGDVIKVRKRK